MSTIIIACDHGLGHIRRCALMARALYRAGERVVLYAPIGKYNHLRRAILSISGLNVIDFSTNTSMTLMRQDVGKAIKWIYSLPQLDKYDSVICDNLPEILSIRPDAVLSANFFWHEVIPDVSEAYSLYCWDLLDRFRPTILGNELFAMDSVRSQTGYTVVGLYKNPELSALSSANQSIARNNLLVSCGSTTKARDQFEPIVSSLMNKGPRNYDKVLFDPVLMPSNRPSWLFEADYTSDMYSTLNAAICRPGLGVVTDLLTVGARIATVYEPDNLEMAHNAKVISTLPCYDANILS